MSKVKQEFVKVTVTGFIKSPDFTAASYKEFEGRVKAIKTVAEDQMTDANLVKKKVTRHVEPEAREPIEHLKDEEKLNTGEEE